MKRIVCKTTDSVKVKLFSSVAVKTTTPIDIKISPAIKRSPTAVLEALASTVGVDTTAPHFAFIDDPSTIPSTMQAKRNYYLSKEMGKRAARQLAEEWPTLFAFDRDQPELPVFRPTKLADPLKIEPTEENLLNMITSREVKDAAILYEKMRTENINISEATQKELFQLICYYNESNPTFTEVEEWHGLRNYSEHTETSASLKPGGLADLLFETLPRSPQNVSTMIAALCKFRSKENIRRAKELYKEFLPQKYIYRNAFDALIHRSSWTNGKEFLKDMNTAEIKPFISTWNALLYSASHILDIGKRHEAFKEVIGEMRKLGVQPSLTSYDLIIKNCCLVSPENVNSTKDITSNDIPSVTAVTWLDECLRELESRSVITLTSAGDHVFFSTAMETACRAYNLDLAEKVVNLYESSKNDVKLPALTSESVFYNLYLHLYADITPSLEDVEKKYRSLVPRLVGSNKQLTLILCNRLQQTPHWPLLRRLIDDGIASRHTTDQKIGDAYRRRLLDVSFESLNVAERAEFAAIVNRLVDIWVEIANFTHTSQSFLQQKLHPFQISQCALLLSRIGDAEKAYKMLELLLDENNKQGPMATVFSHGDANPTIMLELFDAALRDGDVYRAAICLEVISLSKPKETLEQLAARIHKSCKLTEAQSRLIDGYVRLRPE